MSIVQQPSVDNMQTKQKISELAGKNIMAWSISAKVFGMLLLLLVAAFHQTIIATAMIWWDASDTYIHGMFVVPAVVWMIWSLRGDFLKLSPSTSYLGVSGIAIFGLLWIFASIAGIAVGQQLSFFAMLPMLVLAVFGCRVTHTVWYPLLYLLFAVPMGEFLIPSLMQFTAWFAVKGLQLTGIPVYWEGLMFEIPSGNFEVVKACSGIRYLIASIALGYFYAFLTYRSTKRRLLFIALSIVFPILANGLRAYGIVMIAHLSDMEYATGFDHIIYGWVWFGVVMLIMFWIGSFWREDGKSTESKIENNENTGSVTGVADPLNKTSSAPDSRRIIKASIAVCAVILFVPAALLLLINVDQSKPQPQISISEVGPVDAAAGKLDFVANPCNSIGLNHRNADMLEAGCFVIDGVLIGYANAQYFVQNQNKELINVNNKLYDDDIWKNISERGVEVPMQTSIGEVKVKVQENTLKSRSGAMLVWSWIKTGKYNSSGKLRTKLNQVKSIVLDRRSDAIIEVLTIKLESSAEDARDKLKSLLFTVNRDS